MADRLPFTEPKLSMADQLLVNLVGAMLVAPVRVGAEQSFYLGEIGRVLGRVSRDSVRIRDLAEAATALVGTAALRADPDPGVQAPWHRAHFDAAVALEQIFRWRAGQAQAAVFATEGPA